MSKLKENILQVLQSPQARTVITRALNINERLGRLSDIAKNGLVSANRVASGTLQAGVQIVGGGAKFTDTGIILPDTSTTHRAYPSDTGLEADWLKGPSALAANAPSPWVGVAPFNDSTAQSRGMILSAEGRVLNANFGGEIAARAGDGDKDPDAASTAEWRLVSGDATNPTGQFIVNADMDANGTFNAWAAANFIGATVFTLVPTSMAAPTLDNHLTRKVYVNTEDATTLASANAHSNSLVAVDSQSPTLASGWTAPNTVRVRLMGNGVVMYQGRVRNSSGSSKPAGARIFTVNSDRRPLVTGTWACARTDTSQVWQNDFVSPVAAQEDGDVVARDATGAGVEIDVSTITYLAGF